MLIEGITDGRTNTGTDKAQDTKYLKIVLEWGSCLDIDRQCNEYGQMPKTTTHQRKVKFLDVGIRGYQKIHRCHIHQYHSKSEKRNQLMRPLQADKCIPRESGSQQRTEKLEPFQGTQVQCIPMQYGSGISILKGILGRQQNS